MVYNVGVPKIKTTKTSRQLERHFKGIANHWRIDILLLVKGADGLTLEEIAEQLGGNIKTVSEHTRRLVQAGLLNKKYSGRTVEHSLSPYGRQLTFLISTFQYS